MKMKSNSIRRISAKPRFRSRPQRQSGFTLIELLLYLGMAAFLLLATSGFLALLLQSKAKNQTIAEVEQQGLQVVQLMTQTIRNGELITAPAQSSSGSSLTLDVVDSADDPTIFDEASGVLRVQEGASQVIALTNNRVVASGLTFQNVSRQDTPGIVRISFVLTHVNPRDRNEFSFFKTFVASAALRHP
ncbi:MAG: hypothetical protein A2666_05220 [Parcubacteria group bacterium RIFCSPHIGHO2_01_FULL_47_10b]|nr:MAG: hypothetical protein A2666_05220 [Parcubacteria group bacterium RIFCSPHIGHO2_01_FULL_47_10b]